MLPLPISSSSSYWFHSSKMASSLALRHFFPPVASRDLDIMSSSSSSYALCGRLLNFSSSSAVRANNMCSGRKAITKASINPTTQPPEREKDPRKRVVITGMGVVSVYGSNVDEYYNKLLAGESGVTLIESFDTTEIPTKIAGEIRGFDPEGYVDPKVGQEVDQSSKYCLVAGWKALEEAQLGRQALQTIDKTRIGVIVGSGIGGGGILRNGIQDFLQKGHKKISPNFMPQLLLNAPSATLAIDAGLMGPSYSMSTACATSNYCFYSAANHIRQGDADVMVAGGAEAAILQQGVAGFIACRVLSERNDEPKRASRPWDKDRDGFVVGEGCGILVMESMEHAMKRGARIIAEYLGGALTCDAYHMTNPRPDGHGVSSCITKALQDARVSPEEVNYVNAHATSTVAGDLVEVRALKKVFKDTSEIKMNGTKSLIGHALGASSGMEGIATIKAITTGWLHPTINQDNLEPEVTIDTVPNVKKQHEVNIAISNAFGFGGHNSVVVFAPFKP